MEAILRIRKELPPPQGLVPLGKPKVKTSSHATASSSSWKGKARKLSEDKDDIEKESDTPARASQPFPLDLEETVDKPSSQDRFSKAGGELGSQSSQTSEGGTKRSAQKFPLADDLAPSTIATAGPRPPQSFPMLGVNVPEALVDSSQPPRPNPLEDLLNEPRISVKDVLPKPRPKPFPLGTQQPSSNGPSGTKRVSSESPSAFASPSQRLRLSPK